MSDSHESTQDQQESSNTNSHSQQRSQSAPKEAKSESIQYSTPFSNAFPILLDETEKQEILEQYWDRDISDQEFNKLSAELKLKLIARKLKMKQEMFNPNYLIMNSTFLNSEIQALSQNEPEGQYISQLMDCSNKLDAKSKMLCIMSIDCKSQFLKYQRCLAQYQKSTFLCKVPKIEMRDCYQRNLKAANLIINRMD
ncbi:UNKNOWN [Stylonychia lemnae]|uniref:Uncharacterized protein n=1 Tax=Stylonychia lemnae TaxID=5949 RepID=A0A078AUA9_STYLE|nr:UNKNOWN [Stylonychia lemnae]|eukprot:CDW84822.1 UNKNOWN [Stylonychia lemnae]